MTTGKIIDANALRKIIPCCPSMVLLDKVYLESETRAIGQKCVTMNDLVFFGHFPGHPILPGVLVLEAVAQLAEVLLGDKLNPGGTGDFYVKEYRKVKFRKPNNPGDRLVVELNVTSIGSDSAEFEAVVTNSAGVACNAQGTVSVRPKVKDETPILTFNKFDKGANCIMSIPEIQSLIPHRFPFLLVDYVCKLEGSHVTAVKNLTQGEAIFRTYNDGYSVLMGAVQSEIAAQAGAIYMLSNEDKKGKIAYFMGIEKTEMFAPVLPGQQLRIEIDMPGTKSKFGRGSGAVYVGDKVVAATSMLFAIVDP